MSAPITSPKQGLRIFSVFPFFFLALIIGYYLFFFILSGLFQHQALWAKVSPDWPNPLPIDVYGYYSTPIEASVFHLVWMGLGALVAGYLLGILIVRRFPIRDIVCGCLQGAKILRIGIDNEMLFLLCALNIAAVAAFYWFEMRPPVFYQLLHSSFFFSLGVIRHGQITRTSSAVVRWIGYGALILFFLAFVAQRQATLLFMTILFLGLLEALHGRRKWLAVGSFCFLTLALVYPLKRTPLAPTALKACQPEIQAEKSPSSRYILPVLIQCESSADRRDLIAAAIIWSRDQALRRISTIRLLDRAMADTPIRVPYFNGETLRPLLYTPIPRFLWPEKPLENIGNRIGHAYRVLNPGDSTTSINLPWIVEFYINFGTRGVIAGLALAGFVLGGLAWLGAAGTRSAVAALFSIGILFPLAYQESNMSLMVGNALHGAAGAVGLIVLAWAARWIHATSGKNGT